MDLRPDLDAFSRAYPEARDKFLAAAHTAGAAVDHHPHPLTGPAGEALATDTAWLGPADASRVLLVLSGTHGVEGLAGSGPQVHWLRRPDALPPDTAVLMVHAVNPHGFAWLRRVTEENVDLNRNWVDFAQPLPDNPGYAALHAHYVPPSLDAPTLAAADAAIDDFRRRHGEAAERVARSSGQYTHADGLFYGGQAPTWARRTSESILAARLGRARTVAIVDLHTGLGPYGYGEPICNHAPSGDRVARARRWWGDSVTEPDRGITDGLGRPREREHGAVGVVAAIDVQQPHVWRRDDGGAAPLDHREVAPFRDVGHAFDDRQACSRRRRLMVRTSMNTANAMMTKLTMVLMNCP